VTAAAPPPSPSRLLLWAGIADLAIAVALAASFVLGARAYSFFGVEFLAEMARRGSAVPSALSVSLAAAAAVAAWYAFTAYRHGARLPWTGTVLTVVAIAFLLRGAWLAIELGRVIPDYRSVRFRELLLSAAAVTIGVLHLAGARNLSAYPK
jgi:hypothetical protein